MNILITGENGYIAKNLTKALSGTHVCKNVSVRDGLPDMAGVSVVIHCAGIVHRKDVNAAEYMSVNADLTARLAAKAASQGVSRFVFMSTMAIYGVDSALRKPAVITATTEPRPTNWYGKSKLAAEGTLKRLASPTFHVDVLRLPMVYGRDCPGNYARLERLVEVLPVFPLVENSRSMLHIDNLAEFVRLLLNREPPGGGFAVFCPQNAEYASTSELAALIAEKRGRRIRLSKTLGCAALLFPIKTVKKLFGNLTFDLEMSGYFDYKYCVKGLRDSVE